MMCDLKATLSGAIFTGQENMTGTTVLQMGSGVSGKETSAGKIAYNIVGAGTTAGSRVVKLYDNVVVAGGLSSTTTISVGGQVVVLTNDSRLSDSRPPTAGSVTDTSVSSAASIAQSKISGLVADLIQKANLSGASFTGDARLSTGKKLYFETSDISESSNALSLNTKLRIIL